MKDVLDYKGYRGSVHFSAEDRVMHGRILGIKDLVNFEGEDVITLEKAFHEAVEDYLVVCKRLGRSPDRAYSGTIPLRIEASLHRRLAVEADSEGKSLNQWIGETLQKVVVDDEKSEQPRRTGAARRRSHGKAAARKTRA